MFPSNPALSSETQARNDRCILRTYVGACRLQSFSLPHSSAVEDGQALHLALVARPSLQPSRLLGRPTRYPDGRRHVKWPNWRVRRSRLGWLSRRAIPLPRHGLGSSAMRPASSSDLAAAANISYDGVRAHRFRTIRGHMTCLEARIVIRGPSMPSLKPADQPRRTSGECHFRAGHCCT